MTVRCPDCGEVLGLGPDLKSGDLVDCPNCAGHAIRLRKAGSAWVATLAHRVSCPDCEELLTLPDDAEPGDSITCCGRHYRLTFAYGAFAAEKL